MDIISLSFEDSLMITINDDIVKLTPYRTAEYGNIKFGIQAPRTINVHREEIFRVIKSKQESLVES